MNMTIHSNWVIKNMGLICQILDKSGQQIGRNCSTNQRLVTAGISITKIWWGFEEAYDELPHQICARSG